MYMLVRQRQNYLYRGKHYKPELTHCSEVIIWCKEVGSRSSSLHSSEDVLHLFYFHYVCLKKSLNLNFSLKFNGHHFRRQFSITFRSIVKMCPLFAICWLDLFIFTRHVTYPHLKTTYILIYQKIRYGRHNISKNLFYRPSGLVVVSSNSL